MCAPGETCSAETCASTRTEFSVPTMRRGSAMSTVFVDAQPARRKRRRALLEMPRFTGRSSSFGKSNVTACNDYCCDGSHPSAGRALIGAGESARAAACREAHRYGVQKNRVVRFEPFVEELVGERLRGGDLRKRCDVA